MTFDLQPTLENDLVRLRPLRAEDFEALFAVAADPLIWEQHPKKDRYRRAVFENYFKGALESGGAFCVRDVAGRLIGSTRYYDLDEGRGGTVCVGYTFIARSAWGGGFNRAMKALMLDHAFRFVDRVIFHVGEHNLRSRRAMEKLGAILAGELEVSYYGEQATRNVVYEIAKRDWIQSVRTNNASERPVIP